MGFANRRQSRRGDGFWQNGPLSKTKISQPSTRYVPLEQRDHQRDRRPLRGGTGLWSTVMSLLQQDAYEPVLDDGRSKESEMSSGSAAADSEKWAIQKLYDWAFATNSEDAALIARDGENPHAMYGTFEETPVNDRRRYEELRQKLKNFRSPDQSGYYDDDDWTTSGRRGRKTGSREGDERSSSDDEKVSLAEEGPVLEEFLDEEIFPGLGVPFPSTRPY